MTCVDEFGTVRVSARRPECPWWASMHLFVCIRMHGVGRWLLSVGGRWDERAKEWLVLALGVLVKSTVTDSSGFRDAILVQLFTI